MVRESPPLSGTAELDVDEVEDLVRAGVLNQVRHRVRVGLGVRPSGGQGLQTGRDRAAIRGRRAEPQQYRFEPIQLPQRVGGTAVVRLDETIAYVGGQSLAGRVVEQQ